MHPRQTLEVLGIDGCPDGWVAVTAREGKFASLHHYPNITELVEDHPKATTFGIDIPLWLPAGWEPRVSDVAARKCLKRRGASVFAVPPRDVLEAGSHAEANALSKKRYGRGVPAQSFGLSGKILEAVRFLESTGDQRLFEVHPELSFHFLAKSLGTEITSSKKRWTGLAERLSLLESVGFAPPLDTHESLGRAAPDDVVDACVAAWSAYRIATGKAELVGAEADSVRAEQPKGHPAVIYA